MKRFGQLLLIYVLCLFFSGCTSNKFEVKNFQATVFSPAMNKEMSYSVYTPPNWNSKESLPLIVFLHGGFDDELSFDRHSVTDTLDSAIMAGDIPRVIFLLPEGEFGFWENWDDGSKLYRDWVMQDLMPQVQEQYSTLPCPTYCFISGISMGGHGALRFGFHERETFSSVSAISAPVISKSHPDKRNFIQKVLQNVFHFIIPRERIWGDKNQADPADPYLSYVQNGALFEKPLLLAWASEDSDRIVNNNEKFVRHLKKQGKQLDYFVFEGRHKWIYWKDIFPEIINFHVNATSIQHGNKHKIKSE